MSILRIAHLSDLHFGHHDEALAGGLAADIATQKPDLVVVSGDFVQDGSTDEFVAARAFLDTLAAPILAVPGNHDVPGKDLLSRFLNPYGRYRRYIAQDIEPFLEIGGVAIAGLNTARRMRLGLNWSHGSISREQLHDLEARFATAPDAAVRIIVAHHPLVQPEGLTAKPMRLVDRADLALQTFARLGVRAVLSGHFHLSYVRKHGGPGEVKEGEPGGPRLAATADILVTQAASTISTRLRGEPNAYNLIDVDGTTINVNVREWQDKGWATREKATADV